MTNTIYIHQPEKAFSFTRLPNFLFEAPTFKPLSNEAKVLYAFILRRTELSRKNGWADDCGRIYLCHGGNLFVKRIAAVGGNVVMHNGINMSVPEGSYYMLGDNADDSYDSRYWDEPFVPVTTVVAKVWLPIGSR